MELISIEDVEKAIANLRAAEAELAKHFGLKPYKAKARRKYNKKANGSRNGAVSTARQLQGKYMGVVRHLSPTDKAKVKKLREEKGYRAAISLAKKLA